MCIYLVYIPIYNNLHYNTMAVPTAQTLDGSERLAGSSTLAEIVPLAEHSTIGYSPPSTGMMDSEAVPGHSYSE